VPAAAPIPVDVSNFKGVRFLKDVRNLGHIPTLLRRVQPVSAVKSLYLPSQFDTAPPSMLKLLADWPAIKKTALFRRVKPVSTRESSDYYARLPRGEVADGLASDQSIGAFPESLILSLCAKAALGLASDQSNSVFQEG
jgi:hypothetical protein